MVSPHQQGEPVPIAQFGSKRRIGIWTHLVDEDTDMGVVEKLPVSLRSGWRVTKQLPGQLQVALVQCTMFDGVQESITHRHRLFIERRMIASGYTHKLIQPFLGKRMQQLLHSSQPAFVACC